ncbi:MAG: hypothetical protein FWC72_03375, partial [Oscillospiraceae bacterium]|nr:hypothetical protein [Oscillospiraceae bacterium]
IVTMPAIINDMLGAQNPIFVELGVGEMVTALFAPAILAFDVPTTIHALQVVSSTLSYLIPVYDRLDELANLDRNVVQAEINDLIARAHQRSVAVGNAIRNDIDSIWNQIQGVPDAFDGLRNQLHVMAQDYRQTVRGDIRNFLNSSVERLRNLLRRF